MCLFSSTYHSSQVRIHAVTIQYHIQTSSIILNIQCFLQNVSEKHSFTLINGSKEERGIKDARPIHSRSNVFFPISCSFLGQKPKTIDWRLPAVWEILDPSLSSLIDQCYFL